MFKIRSLKKFVSVTSAVGINLLSSPTLNKSLKGDLSNDEKSIILPLGEVKLTRKIKSLLILFRTNTEIEIWDQNKRRIFEFPKMVQSLCTRSRIDEYRFSDCGFHFYFICSGFY